MSDIFSRDGWTVTTWDEFSPMAFGPKNVCLTVNDDATITIEHEVPSGYYGGTTTERVTVPRDWLAAMLAAADGYTARRATP